MSLGAGGQIGVLRVLHDRQAKHARIQQRAAQKLGGPYRRAIVGVSENARVGQLAHCGKLLARPPGGDRAVGKDLDRRTARPGRRPDALENPRLVDGGRGVRHKRNGREAAMSCGCRSAGDGLGVLEAGLAEVGVEIEEAGGDDYAPVCDAGRLRGLQPDDRFQDAIRNDNLARAFATGDGVDQPGPLELEPPDGIPNPRAGRQDGSGSGRAVPAAVRVRGQRATSPWGTSWPPASRYSRAIRTATPLAT